ncbi:NAD-P-binding protein, partial [Epithele typhae]|uniref:NAD-P-binding protein n=1 Tax=Epithele typhae TaxID=378194 RepID=UPI0020084342
VGAARGVGLEYVRQLVRTRENTLVFASSAMQAAQPTKQGHRGLNNVHVVEGDVTKYATLESCATKVAEVTGGGLDVLIHNAARMSPETIYKGFDDFSSMDELTEDFVDAYKINALGLIFSITAFLPLLRAAPTKKVVVIGSEGGTPAFVKNAAIQTMCAYGMSKGAQHVAATKWHLKLAPEGFTVVSISPGLVDVTGTMGLNGNLVEKVRVEATIKASEGTEAPMTLWTPTESVLKQLGVIDGLTPERSGEFISTAGFETA